MEHLKRALEGLIPSSGSGVPAAAAGRLGCTSRAGWNASFLLVAVASLATAGPLAAAEQAKPAGPQIVVGLKKAGDRAEAGKTKEGALVTIHSESGIGAATLVRPERGWPRSVTIRFDLKGMESVRIEGGGLWSESFLGGELRRPYWKTGQDRNTEATASGRLDFAVTRIKGGVQVDVPKELLNTNPAVISLQWVDFFR